MASREKLIEKAQKYLQKGKYKDALKVYDKILKDSPDDVRIILRKGEMEEKLGFVDDAVDSYEFVAQRYSDDGFYPKAIAIYKKIIKINAEDMGVHMKLGTLYKKLNIDTEAKMYYTKVADYYKSNGLKQEYLEVVKIISEFAGEDTGSKIDLAQEYLEQGDRDQAIDQFRAASQRIYESANVRELDLLVEKMDRLGLDDLDTQQIQIKTYMEAKEPKKALRIIQKVYAVHPTNTDALEMLAACFKELDQPEKASSVYTELSELYKNNGELEKSNRAIENRDLLGEFEPAEATNRKFKDQALDDLGDKLDIGTPDSIEARTEVLGEDDVEDELALNELANFDDAPASESTVHASKPKPKPRPKKKPRKPVAALEDDVIEDLDFIMSSEVSKSSDQIEVEAVPVDDKLSSEKETRQKSVSADIDIEFDDFERKAGTDVSQEIDLTLDDVKDKVQDPYSEDVSELSFQSFVEPVAQAEISAEEISGLIDKPSKAKDPAKESESMNDLSMSKLDAEMLQDDEVAEEELQLSDVIEVQEAPASAPKVEEKIELTGFDEFTPDVPEKSELSVNEEEFVMVQESLEEASLNDLSKEDSIANWSPDEAAKDEGLDLENSFAKVAEPPPAFDQQDLDVAPEAMVDESSNSSMDIELPSEISEVNEIVGLDVDEMNLDVSGLDEPADADKTQYDPNNQTQVDFSTQDFGNLDDSKVPGSDALDLSDIAAEFEEEISEEPQEEIALETDPPPASERDAAPNTDLDNIQFETEHSFPEYELSNPASSLPENISEQGSGFFDLADSLKDEIDDLEKSFAKSDDEDDEDVEHLTPEEVILEFKKGIARTIDKNDSQTYYELGAAYKEMGLIDEAISAFDTARKGAEYKVDASSLIGICYMDKKDFGSAIKTFDEILQSVSYQDPKALGIRYELAECYIALGRHMEAYKEFQKVKDVDANYRDVVTRTKELAFNLGIQEKDTRSQAGKIIVNLKERKKKKL